MEVVATTGSMMDKTDADGKEFTDSKLQRAITNALVSVNSEE